MERDLTARDWPPSAVAVGDVFADYVCDLTDPELAPALAQGGDLFAPVAVEVGGGAVQFALAARQAGFRPVALVGKVGGTEEVGALRPDPAGDRVRSVLEAHGVTALWSLGRGEETGRAVVVFGPDDRRVMVSDPLANATLEPAELTLEMRAAVRAADLVHVAGYVLLQPARRAAVLELMEEARAAGATVAFDLVPHDLFRYLDGAELLRTLRPLVTWLLVELRTAQGVLGHERTALNRPEGIERTMEALVLEFPSVALYLKPWRALVRDQGQRWEMTFDYASGPGAEGRPPAHRRGCCMSGCNGRELGPAWPGPETAWRRSRWGLGGRTSGWTSAGCGWPTRWCSPPAVSASAPRRWRHSWTRAPQRS